MICKLEMKIGKGPDCKLSIIILSMFILNICLPAKATPIRVSLIKGSTVFWQKQNTLTEKLNFVPPNRGTPDTDTTLGGSRR